MSSEFFAVLAGANTVFAPAQAGFKLDANTNIIIDANSYYAKWVYDPINEVGDLKKLISEKGITSVTNVAIPGQTWANMRMNISDLVRAFDPNKTNVLVCGETRNWVASTSGATVAQAVAQAKQYIEAAQEAVTAKYGRPFDRVVLCGTIPNSTFGDEPWKGDVPGLNVVLRGFDDYTRAHYEELGANAFADFRANTQWFGGDGTTKPGFAQSQEAVLEKLETGEWVHPTGAARDAFAAAIAEALKRLEM